MVALLCLAPCNLRPAKRKYGLFAAVRTMPVERQSAEAEAAKRVRAAIELSDLVVRLMLQGIQDTHPHLSPSEVRELGRARLRKPAG